MHPTALSNSLVGKLAFLNVHLVCRLLAEVSNPFLIYRTIMKIKNLKDNRFYFVNDIMFALVFIFARVILTPLFVVYMYEAENVLYSIKLGIAVILFVQLIWAYRIIELILDTIQ